MRLFEAGISSYAVPWSIGVDGYERLPRPMGAFELLELAHTLNARVLQIADNLPLHKLSPQEQTRLGEQARSAGIALEAGTKGLGVENLMEYLDIARRLGAHLVRTLPHIGSDRPDLPEARRRLSHVLPAYEKAGVTLAVENHDLYPAQWLADLVSGFSSPCLGVCLDSVNNLGQGESENEVFRALAPYCVNFHCKDYSIHRKPSQLGFDVEGAPLGEGRLDLVRALAVLKPGISWILESWLPWQGSIGDTTKKEHAWAVSGMARLLTMSEK